MTRSPALQALLVALLLAGCATSYGSGPNAFTGGVAARSLGSDLYEVRVEANGYTSAARAREMMQLKSAEVALANGFDAYEIVSERDTSTPGYTEEILVERGGYVERLQGTTRNAKPGYRRTVRLRHSYEAGAGSSVLYPARTIYAELAPRHLGTSSAPRLTPAAQAENDRAMARLANCKRDRPEVWRTDKLRCMYG